MSLIGRIVSAGIFAVGAAAPALASSLVIDGYNGTGSTENVAPSGTTSLWSLTGGASNFSDATYSSSYNSKNETLQYYVVATGSSGSSVFSLGELSGSGFGTNAVNVVQSGGGYSLVDSSQSSRDVSNLTSLQIYTVGALPNGAGGTSSAVTVNTPGATQGSYNLAQLQSSFTPTTVSNVTVTSGKGSYVDSYTGVSLSTLLGLSSLSNADVLNDIVIGKGTDGYLVVLAAAELDPALGGNGNDLLAYADTGTDFPADGVARFVLPGDAKAGRFDSNLDEVDLVSTTPLPPTWTMMLLGLAGLGFVGYRQGSVTRCRLIAI